MIRTYVAGPMRGIDNFNFPAFDAAAAYLRALGHDVVNPADLGRAQGFDGTGSVTEVERRDMMRRDIYELTTCDSLALLPGWENSPGARLERKVAEETGIDVYHIVPWVSLTPEVAPIIVALGYSAQVGKDTAGQMMVEMAGFERIAFADPLKAVALAADPKLRQAVQGAGWEEVKRQHPTARIFLQHLGSAVREHVDPNAWINAALRKIKPGGRYVITDCRYKNEAEIIKSMGGYVVKVERPGFGPINDHASEHEMADWDFDAILRNTGTLDDLRSRVSTLLRTL